MDMFESLAIVGGGQSAKYLLLGIAHAVVAGRLPSTLTIGIYEQGHGWGTGLAWCPDNVSDVHVSSLATPSRRAEVGRGELKRFEQIVAFLVSLGVSVTSRSATLISSVERAGQGWTLRSDKGALYQARHVVLAIGHSAFAEQRFVGQAHLRPWPFRTLCERVQARVATGRADVLVLGSYLTAVDVVAGLDANFGTDPARLRMSVLSGSGELPKVWGAPPPALDVDTLSRRVLSDTVLQRCAGNRFGLDEIERMILQVAFEGGTEAVPETSLEAELRRLCAGESAERLKRDLQETAGGAVIAWQTALFGGLPLLSEAFADFTDRDKLRFLSIRSRYYRAAMPMARENALRLDALFDRGVLCTLAAPAGYQLDYSNERRVHSLSLADESGRSRHVGEFDFVVAAAGSDTRLAHSASPLLRQLYDSGLACGVYAHDAGRSVELGGVRVNARTCEMLPARASLEAGAGRLFAMGPLLIGTFPDAQSVGHIARDAERIVERLVVLNIKD
ncbi:Uncharacterized NAD(P)/FAD-binding protein YdhS [Pseudomonas sp. NFR09]|uniref:hypothetical protein n=1 Tax=Pseudomonas sp. NFR09 TaxID=1566249 RepID=UPI0008C6270C|nr:hypothetical protein [Pseudomonas sp. NFR09]SEU11109.1 Uncharacterized NAD(P)/FAD-binding protein YdhS [Pseudomonas sp. NFR09]